MYTAAVYAIMLQASVRDTAAVYAMSDIAYTAAVYAMSDIEYTAAAVSLTLACISDCVHGRRVRNV